MQLATACEIYLFYSFQQLSKSATLSCQMLILKLITHVVQMILHQCCGRASPYLPFLIREFSFSTFI